MSCSLLVVDRVNRLREERVCLGAMDDVVDEHGEVAHLVVRRLAVYYDEKALDVDAVSAHDREHYVLPCACCNLACRHAPELLGSSGLPRAVFAVAESDEHHRSVLRRIELNVHVLSLTLQSERLLQLYESAEGVAAVARALHAENLSRLVRSVAQRVVHCVKVVVYNLHVARELVEVEG